MHLVLLLQTTLRHAARVQERSSSSLHLSPYRLASSKRAVGIRALASSPPMLAVTRFSESGPMEFRGLSITYMDHVTSFRLYWLESSHDSCSCFCVPACFRSSLTCSAIHFSDLDNSYLMHGVFRIYTGNNELQKYKAGRRQ